MEKMNLGKWIKHHSLVAFFVFAFAILLVTVNKGSLGSSVERRNIKPLKRPAIN